MALGFRISSLAALTTAALMPLGRVLRLRQRACRMGDGCRYRCCCSGGTGRTSGSCSTAGRARSGGESAARPAAPRSRSELRAARPDPSAAGPRTRNRRRSAGAGAARRRARSSRRCRCRTRDRGRTPARRASPTAATSRARSSRLAPTPPATTSRACPVAPSAASAFATSTSTTACWNSRAMSARRASSSVAAGRLAAHQRQRRGLQAAEAHVEVAAREHRPRQRHGAVASRSPRGRASAGPPGYGRPSSFAVLSKASPAASSFVSPSSR